MKRAREWAGNRPELTDLTRLIQADALRYAANLSGPLHRTHVLAIADALERIASGMELAKDRELENSL